MTRPAREEMADAAVRAPLSKAAAERRPDRGAAARLQLASWRIRELVVVRAHSPILQFPHSPIVHCTPVSVMSKTSVAFGGIGERPCEPYARSGGMIRRRCPPTFMPTTP